jgi:hypothetical protein
MFRDRCRYVSSESVGAWHVNGDEFNIAIHQAGNEMHIAVEPVELGTNQDGAALPAFCERGKKLRPLSPSMNCAASSPLPAMERETASGCASMPESLMPCLSVETR